MTAPNIGSTASSVFLRADSGVVGTSATTIVSNATGTSAVLRITRFDVAHVNASTNAATITVVRAIGTATTTIVSTVAVPSDAVLRIYDATAGVAVPEGHDITAASSDAGYLNYDVEYQEFK